MGVVVFMALVAVHMWAGRLAHSYRTYQFQRSENCRLTRLLEDRNQQLCLKMQYVERFRNSPSFRDYLVRERLGLIAPNEYVVRFISDEMRPIGRE
jgi:hypothetical protein